MWIIKQILEADYGCEERMPGEKLKCLVYLENDQGEQRRLEAEDDWLREWKLEEETVWPGEQNRILGALIGLIGAVSNSGKTMRTDLVVARALLREDEAAVIAEIHAEKNQISPDCAVCKNPCGNTADRGMMELWDCEEAIRRQKCRLIDEARKVAEQYLNGDRGALPDLCYRAIVSLGYGMDAAAYEELIGELTAERMKASTK